MLFQSTRSGSVRASAVEAVLQGLAPDGGLYIDPSLGSRPFDWRGCLRLAPLDMASMILSHLLPGFEDMPSLVAEAYIGKFSSDCLTPLVPVGDDYALELFHGPTSAFKDVALSMLPQLMTAGRRQQGAAGKTLILTATSGDTGKAALEGFHDVPGTGIIVFYPDRGVSPVQRLQMVSQRGGNVRVCAVRGNFDDCQRGVKQAFAAFEGSAALSEHGVSLSSANSINIGRLAPQVTYYFIAYARLMDMGRISAGEPVDFVVPTGNFGDILAGFFARLMGLPVGKLVCASNGNRVLTDFLETGIYDRRRDFLKTMSPSMDILVSSNLERLLFLASGGDSQLVCRCMEQLSNQGCYRFDGAAFESVRAVFPAFSCGEEDTLKTIGRLWHEQAYLCDTHTAVGFFAAEQYKRVRQSGAPLVVLSTASPYKFPAAVLRAVGGDCGGDEFEQMEKLCAISAAPIPENLAGLKNAPVLHDDLIAPEQITEYIGGLLAKEGV